MNNRDEMESDRWRDTDRYEFDRDRARGGGRGARRYDADEIYGGRDEELPSDYDRGERYGTRRSFDAPYGRSMNESTRYSGTRSGWSDPRGWEPRGYESDASLTGRYHQGGGYSGRSRFDEGTYEDRSRYWSGGGFPESGQRGQFAGKGPKGYRRSDERIAEDINEALSQNADIDASEIEVKVQNGEVTLSGTVDERHFKRMAEELAERCSGVKDVRNEIRVQSASGETSQPSRAKAGSAQGRSGESRSSSAA